MKKLLTILAFLSYLNSHAQQIVTVAELTLKVSAKSTEKLYYSFAEGDQIVFSFEEVDGKELKEVDITEYPNTSKFMDYETKKIDGKRIDVLSKSVFQFSFTNSNILKGRVCRIKIQRIPAKPEYNNFNTNVKWVVKQDTMWRSYTEEVVVGYDTVYLQKTKKTLISTSTEEQIVMSKNQKVHSKTNENGNKSSVFFTLPEDIERYNETRKVIAWAYWVGVGEEGNKAWERNRRILVDASKLAASTYSSPLGGFAAGVVANMALPPIGEDVIYGLTDKPNYDKFWANYQYGIIDGGKGAGGCKRFTNDGYLHGTYYIVLLNDNYMVGIDVNIAVSAIIEVKKYEYTPYTERKIEPQYEKQIKREPIIKTEKFPVPFDYK